MNEDFAFCKVLVHSIVLQLAEFNYQKKQLAEFISHNHWVGAVYVGWALMRFEFLLF